ncbi:ergothioneine biosynthesis protein EgtB [Marinimicrobium alkaliphilum]|uniref:ergothioneine biosynthesis protein EgtB n=1 Tax=Marinimicrobium alkaliphilum TaxID=2202654 RepID=UPI000DB969B6|nr:ergothioneine biosynthesis protein EgtB [Marinimicrobium alkaliphilum]
MPLAEKYKNTRQVSETLCSPVPENLCNTQVIDYASPPKWNLAHTSWFFEEMILKKYVGDYREFDPTFGFLFNSYYNHVGDRIARDSRGDISVPSMDTVSAYRNFIDDQMRSLLESRSDPAVEALTILGINHEQQHQELFLTDLKYVLSRNSLYPSYGEGLNLVNDANTTLGQLDINEGLYEVGHTGDGFHFDNECNRHKVYLNAYSIDRALVTNAEYLDFIEDGGYEKFQYWLDDGWHWLQESGIRAPLYWLRINGHWHYYTFAGLQPVNPEAMLCHVSFYEANAFASWKGKRLPTEFEWEVASAHLPWGKRWEWTNSAYLPYPGFSIGEDAVGEYNGKFMINQMVLRGASVATPKHHSRPTYRNFFHPHLQWQFSGIRLAERQR